LIEGIKLNPDTLEFNVTEKKVCPSDSFTTRFPRTVILPYVKLPVQVALTVKLPVTRGAQTTKKASNQDPLKLNRQNSRIKERSL
jgi:hypothetical protein